MLSSIVLYDRENSIYHTSKIHPVYPQLASWSYGKKLRLYESRRPFKIYNVDMNSNLNLPPSSGCHFSFSFVDFNCVDLIHPGTKIRWMKKSFYTFSHMRALIIPRHPAHDLSRDLYRPYYHLNLIQSNGDGDSVFLRRRYYEPSLAIKAIKLHT